MTNRYLQDNFAPVREEQTVTDLPVTGPCREHLDGRYLRIGPNPLGNPGENHHWFLGDGMVHGVRIVDGRGEVVPQPLRALQRASPASWASRVARPDWPVGDFAANTHVISARRPDAGAGRGRVAAVRADRGARHRRPHRLRRDPADGSPARRLHRPPARGPRDRRAARGVLQLAARQPGRLHGARHRRAHPQDGAGRGRRQPDDARLRADRELRRALRPAGGLRQAARDSRRCRGRRGCRPG